MSNKFKIKRNKRTLLFAVLLLMINTSALAAPRLPVRILKSQPHDPQSFTQGFIYTNGDIIESSGLYGQSFIRRYSATTGKVKHEAFVPKAVFAEGIEIVQKELLVLTWKSGTLLRYNLENFQLSRTQRYKGQGWGLAKIGNVLVMSNGTAQLSFRDTESFKELKTLTVVNDKTPLFNINELEFDGTSLWANQWQNTSIYKIDHNNGKVVAIYPLDTLVPELTQHSNQNVLNGIAYVPEQKAFWITGKRWPNRYLVQFLSH